MDSMALETNFSSDSQQSQIVDFTEYILDSDSVKSTIWRSC
jgi:hypothetical protein